MEEFTISVAFPYFLLFMNLLLLVMVIVWAFKSTVSKPVKIKELQENKVKPFKAGVTPPPPQE